MTESATTDGADIVVDASAMVDLLAGTELAPAVAARLAGSRLHAPSLFDAKVLSALARLERAGDISAADATAAVGHLEAAPVARTPLAGLLAQAWARRASLRVTDALYVALATRLDATLVTTDARLSRNCAIAELIGT